MAARPAADGDDAAPEALEAPDGFSRRFGHARRTTMRAPYGLFAGAFLAGSVGGLAAGASEAGIALALVLLAAALSGAAIALLAAGRAAAGAEGEAAADRRWEAGESFDQVSRLLEELGDLAIARDIRGRIVSANRAFRAVTGCASPIGMTLFEAGFLPVADGAADAAGRTLGTAAPDDEDEDDTERTMRLRTAGGEDAWFTWRHVAVRDTVTGALRIHSIGRDVTAQKRAEADLIAGRNRAESASAAKSRFLAMVSHEIRTPLNGVLGMTELLANTRLTREQETYVGAVRESGHALMTLIEDLLDFSGMEAGRLKLRRAPFDLPALVAGLVELSAARADRKGIEIAAHISPLLPPTLIADEGRLRQVLHNLVGNALKFTETGGVFLEVAPCHEGIAFRVVDTGPGLAEADRERIFEEFEQADNGPTRRHGGAGLGLAISARLVRAMGGTIGVRSELGRGSTFEVRLPMDGVFPKDGDGAGRTDALAESRVILIAPEGPTATALARLIEDHGGVLAACADAESVRAAVAHMVRTVGEPTDVIVDYRLADGVGRLLADLDRGLASKPRRTMMVTPAERAELTRAKARSFSAWLIRPLRTASLIKVLRRETGDLEAWFEEREVASPLGASAARLKDAGRDADRDDADAEGGEAPSLRVLVAEDNPVNALLVRAALAKAGHAVEVVGNGRELVDRAYDPALARARFDVLVTDLSMPEMDGRAAVTAIRGFEKRRRLPPLPIVILSADGQRETRLAALAEGASDYVEKPVDPAALVATIARLGARAA